MIRTLKFTVFNIKESTIGLSGKAKKLLHQDGLQPNKISNQTNYSSR